MPEVEAGLGMTEAEFLTAYGFDKPKLSYPDGKLNVIYCMSGVRARKAETIFKKFGEIPIRPDSGFKAHDGADRFSVRSYRTRGGVIAQW